MPPKNALTNPRGVPLPDSHSRGKGSLSHRMDPADLWPKRKGKGKGKGKGGGKTTGKDTGMGEGESEASSVDESPVISGAEEATWKLDKFS